MANKIQFKRSLENGSRPVVGDLDLGEIAANVNEDQPGLFIKVADDSQKNFDVVKIGPTVVSKTAPDQPSKGETWLTNPDETDVNQRFPTLKVHDGSKFVDAIRMVIPEIKPLEPGNINYTIKPDMSGDHIHVTDASNIEALDIGVDFLPGQAVSIYNGREGYQLQLFVGDSIVHFAGTPPQQSIGIEVYKLNPGALVTLLCVNKQGVKNSNSGTFVLSGAGVA